MTANIATALDDRLAAFKRELVDEQGDSLPVLKSNGNKQQFQHELKVIEKLEDAKCALEQKKYEKAQDALSQGINLVKFLH